MPAAHLLHVRYGLEGHRYHLFGKRDLDPLLGCRIVDHPLCALVSVGPEQQRLRAHLNHVAVVPFCWGVGGLAALVLYRRCRLSGLLHAVNLGNKPEPAVRDGDRACVNRLLGILLQLFPPDALSTFLCWYLPSTT